MAAAEKEITLKKEKQNNSDRIEYKMIRKIEKRIK